MNKTILLIDDKEEFKNDFQSLAQRNGYGLAWGKSYEQLVAKLPILNLDITAVILDVKCLMTDDQQIERADFIGSALNYLNREYPDVPRMILTGDDKSLEGIKNFYNTDEEDIYKKEPQELDRLFSKLEKHYEKHPERILSVQEKELFKIIQNGEGKHLEYKSSIQFCVRNQVENKELRFEVLKNLAAFANSEGGELLIGVSDDKDIIGLENTDFLTLKVDDKQDGLRLLIDNLVEINFGNDFHENLEDMKFYNSKGNTVCRIIVKGKHNSPVFLKKKPKNGNSYNAFFVRGQASAREIRGEELDKYLKTHWSN